MAAPEGTDRAVGEIRFRDAMASLPAGVAVVTAWAGPGDPRGATVSAVCSLSAEPPLLLACLAHTSDTCQAIQVGDAFLVNILAETQADVALRFAIKDPDKFTEVGWTVGLLGLPQLDGVQTAVACEATERLPGGDHTIVVGRVCATDIRDEETPLLHWRRQFGRFGPHPGP
jgi:flavin reductase (DIM6/NTAB) family NADH-FMN oxidoreductase RutF